MNDYNKTPEGLKEVPLDEWTQGMLHYCIKISETRQVCDGKNFNLRMFDVPNFDDKKLGYAIMDDWFDNDTQKNRPKRITRFCRYGLDEDWKIFHGKFAAQFAGDNS
jgi:hypothetical protein